MSRQEPFNIGSIEVASGTRGTVELPIAKLYTHSEMTLPVHVVHGKKPGPVLFVSAAIHGDEINGVEIIRRLLKKKNLNRLNGTLLAIPVVNPFGFIFRSRYLPDRRDLNRSFPGSPGGSLASRVADVFMNEIVCRSTHGIDLHTGSNYRSNLPQIRTSIHKEENLRLAKVFGTPMIVHSQLRDGSLREAVSSKDLPMLLYEAGEALYFNEAAIRSGIKGILNVMREIGMLAKKKQTATKEPVVSKRTSWVRAVKSGVLYRDVSLGDRIYKGDRLCVVSDTMGEAEEAIFAPFTGVIIGLLTLPLVHEGDAIIHLARVEDINDAEEVIENYESELTEEDFSLER